MKHTSVSLLVLLAIAAPVCTLTNVGAAYAQNAATASIKAAAVGTDYAGSTLSGASGTFKPGNHTLHSVLELAHIENSTRYKAAWIAVDAAGLKNYVIGEFTPPVSRSNVIHARLQIPRDFPVGRYRVDWYQDSKVVRSIAFTIQ